MNGKICICIYKCYRMIVYSNATYLIRLGLNEKRNMKISGKTEVLAQYD